MSRSRDLGFEALASVTNTDWSAGRGELNHALASIREQSQIHDDVDLANEIVYRARLYREFMGEGIALTPTALAKHWKRVLEQQPKAPATNQQAPATGCPSCEGMGMVLVRVREGGYEEWGPCPQCRGVADSQVMFL